MTIRRINPPELFDGEAFGMSQGSVDDGSGLQILTGQDAWDKPSADLGTSYLEQTQHALENLRSALDAAGSSRQQVLHLRVYVRGELEEHMEHMEHVVPALAAFFDQTRPAVTGVGVQSLATRDTLVELEAVARVALGGRAGLGPSQEKHRRGAMRVGDTLLGGRLATSGDHRSLTRTVRLKAGL